MRQIGASVAYASGQVSRAPVISATRDSCRITHRELVLTVLDSTNFAVVKTIALNPGLKASFPWLATQAVGWQAYRFNSLRFCYYTRCATTQLGSVMLIPDYDAADAAPGSEQIASSFEDVAEDSPWKDIVCAMKPNAMDTVGPRHFVRTGALAAGQDIKLADVGNLFVASVGGTGGAQIGKLWAEYDITFHTPQLPSDGSVSVMAEVESGGATIAAATPFGTVPVFVNDGLFPQISTNKIRSFTAADNTIGQFVNGRDYLFLATGTGTVISAAALTAFSGCNSKTVLFEDFPAAAVTFACAHTFTCTDSSVMSVQLGLTATTITDVKLTVIALNDDSAW